MFDYGNNVWLKKDQEETEEFNTVQTEAILDILRRASEISNSIKVGSEIYSENIYMCGEYGPDLHKSQVPPIYNIPEEAKEAWKARGVDVTH